MNLIQIKTNAEKLLDTHGIAYKAIIAILMFFAPIKLYIASVCALLLIDTIVGVWAAIVKGGRVAFKSKKLWVGICNKLFPYLLLMAVGLFIDKQLISIFNHTHYYLTFFLSVLITGYEASSIVEKLIQINPDFIFLKRFTSLLDALIAKQQKSIVEKLGVETNIEEGEVSK